MLRVVDESGEVLLEVGPLEGPKAPESGYVATLLEERPILDRATHPFWRAQVPERVVGEPLRWEHIQRGMEWAERQWMNALTAELRRVLNEPNPLLRWLGCERTDGPGDYFMRYRPGTNANDDPGEAA